MGRNSWHKKPSFTILNIFKGKKAKGNEEVEWDDYVKAYKVFSSDQDGARWVAQPGIDKRAGAYIDSITGGWNHLSIAD
ncbi:hypothetical protein Lser_V15G44857 [Lactuca serriola]